MFDFLRDTPVNLPNDASQMQDVIDIEGVFTHAWIDYLPVFFVSLGIIFFLILLILLFKKWQKKKASREENLKPDERFYADINRLMIQNLIEKGETKKFYFFISEIARRFISDYFQYPALDKTQSEIEAEFIRNSVLDAGKALAIGNFLSKAEKIKFGGFVITTEEVKNDVHFLKSWVKDVYKVI
ncbi:MAG: hypothetical protein ACD_73C00111G0005 [uncultured bacterium]|nr:MAG: hypothetical protein ACD_73C00111G0005 [uncultured bacterium]